MSLRVRTVAPSAPSLKDVTDVTYEALKLRWKGPVIVGGTRITNYTLQYRRIGATDFSTVVLNETSIPTQTTGNDTTYFMDIVGLRFASEYEFFVVATNNAGSLCSCAVLHGVACKNSPAPLAASRLRWARRAWQTVCWQVS